MTLGFNFHLKWESVNLFFEQALVIKFELRHFFSCRLLFPFCLSHHEVDVAGSFLFSYRTPKNKTVTLRFRPTRSERRREAGEEEDRSVGRFHRRDRGARRQVASDGRRHARLRRRHRQHRQLPADHQIHRRPVREVCVSLIRGIEYRFLTL